MLANNVLLFAHLYNMLVMHKMLAMLANNVLLFAHLYNMLVMHKHVGQQCSAVWTSLQHVSDA